MGFGLKRITKGIATGGLSEAARLGGNSAARRGALALGTGGFSELLRALNPNAITQDQVPLETPEQAAARRALLNFGESGTYGNFTAGADVGIQPGDFSLTPTELSGQSALADLLSSSLPAGYGMTDAALADLLNPNPQFIQSQFDPFKAQVDRMIQDSTNQAKRDLAYSGNLYSTSAINRIGDIQARGNETLTAQLAGLTDQALNRRLQAVPLALQSAAGQENTRRARISDAFQYGGLSRDLNNASINDRNAEILRRRNELLLPLNALTNVAGQNANFGVPSVTTYAPNPFMDLLQSLIGAGGQILGRRG